MFIICSYMYDTLKKTEKRGKIMSERTGYNSIRTKNRNRGIVLRLIAGEHLSRAEITKRIGLTKMAITKIVSELIDDGYVIEGKSDSGQGVGRSPTSLDISPNAPAALGLYISRNSMQVVISSLNLELLFSDSLPLKNETRATLTEKIFFLCDKALHYASACLSKTKIIGIGVSAVGPLDPAGGMILDPTNFFGITEYPVCELLRRRYGLPVLLENDMNAAAIAERFYGIGKKTDSFMYVGITNGIGAGIILEGRLAQLCSTSVGEIGHMSINFDGPLCSCGNKGCLEVYANLPVIEERLEKAVGKPVLPMDFAHFSLHPSCVEIFDDLTEKFAVALVNSINFLDLQSIVIGHEGIYLPDSFFSGLEERVNARILSKGYKKIGVRRSTFGSSAPLLGSACLVFDRLFAGEQLE